MDREARRVGRSLVRNEEEFEEDDDYDDDLMDLEASNVVLTPLLRSDLLLRLLLNPDPVCWETDMLSTFCV